MQNPEPTGQPEPTEQPESALPSGPEVPEQADPLPPLAAPDNLRLGTEGKRTHPLSGLVLGLLWGAAVAVAFALPNLRDDDWLLALISLPVGFVLGVAAGYVRWWFTRYVINDSEIRIETGPIFRSSRRIPFTRLQSIDINQPLIARLLGLAELTIEMAGGSESSSSLKFVPLAEAKVMRATVLQRSRALTGKKSPSLPGATPGTELPSEPGGQAALVEDGTPDLLAKFDEFEQRSIITTVSPQRLIIGAVLSLDMLFAVLGGIVFVVVVFAFDVPWAVLGGAIPFAIGIFNFISSRIFAQWDFTLSRGEHGLRITRGLFDRSSQTIPFDRIQGLEVVEPLLWRKYGWVRLEIDVAGYGIVSAEDGVSVTTLLPISDWPLAQALIGELIAEPHPETHQEFVNRASKRARVFAPIGWKHRWLTRSADAVCSYTGWITKRTQIIPQAKVQSVSIDQGPWQRRLKVASVSIQTPDGPVNIELKHLDAELAPALVLAEIEQSREARLQVGAPAGAPAQSSGTHGLADATTVEPQPSPGYGPEGSTPTDI